MSGLKWENVFCWLLYLLLTLGERDRGSRIMNLALSNGNGHITLNTPVLVRPLKLSNCESSQYLELDGWPPGNTWCCWLLYVLVALLASFSTFLSTFWLTSPKTLLTFSSFWLSFPLYLGTPHHLRTRRLLRDLSTYGLGTLLELLNWYISKSSLLSLMLYTCEDYWRSCEPILAFAALQ